MTTLRPGVSTVYATRIGAKTFDQDGCGGNPFATALLRAMAQPGWTLAAALAQVKAETEQATNGLQIPVWQLQAGHGRWPWASRPRADTAASSTPTWENRQALVLVVADYGHSEQGHLAGAALDERRVAAGLAQQGFSVTQGVGYGRAALMAALRGFVQRSAQADVALIYCTGHGAHSTPVGTVVLPGDYPCHKGYSNALLGRHAVPVDALRDACRATAVNLVLFAGCRTRARKA